MRIRRSSAALTLAAAAGLFAIATPVAGASPTSPPAAASTLPALLVNFVPPKVGPISVDIGRTIINGQITSPGVHILMPPVTVPMNWAPHA